ncbi:MAG: pYEATS domain-containing protein, partial [Bacteroidota bacterium]
MSYILPIFIVTMYQFTIDHRANPIWGTKNWQSTIWIVAENRFLDIVEYVHYYLHPTFEEGYVESFRRDANFRAQLTCWGSFDIKVTAFLKSGNSLSVEYFLNHDQIEPTRPVIKFQEVEQIQIT